MNKQKKYDTIMEYIRFEYGTEAAFAHAVGISPRTVSNWLHGKTKPAGQQIMKMKQKGVPMNVLKALYFLFEKDDGVMADES